MTENPYTTHQHNKHARNNGKEENREKAKINGRGRGLRQHTEQREGRLHPGTAGALLRDIHGHRHGILLQHGSGRPEHTRRHAPGRMAEFLPPVYQLLRVTGSYAQLLAHYRQLRLCRIPHPRIPAHGGTVADARLQGEPAQVVCLHHGGYGMVLGDAGQVSHAFRRRPGVQPWRQTRSVLRGLSGEPHRPARTGGGAGHYRHHLPYLSERRDHHHHPQDAQSRGLFYVQNPVYRQYPHHQCQCRRR